MTVQELRALFPQLSRQVYGKPLVYLDNAATSQRPQSVMDCWNALGANSNANIHRAVHLLASEATQAYENARRRVRGFIGAGSEEEVIFTSGDTAAINLVAYSFSEAFVGEGDEIIVSEAEHHSNLVPWQQMCIRRKASLKVLPVGEDGTLRLDLLESLLSDKTRILAVTHVSNVLGLVNPVAELVRICHSRNVPVLVDGAQGIVHCPVNVQELDCDFYAFSGHKMYAATGTGVLYAKKKYLEKMPPFMSGGEMVGEVSFERTTFAPLPHRFEAGTQNFNAAPTMVPAIDTLELMRDPQISAVQEEITEYVRRELKKISGVRLFGDSEIVEKIPLFSFVVDGAHHEDLALILDKMGVAVRSGQMCAEPLMTRFGVTGMLRASFAPYNTMEEAEFFVQSLNKAIAMLR